MGIKKVIQSQYFASLAMLKQAIVKCPSSVWDAPEDKDKAWFKAYHTLYYAHKYIQINTRDFVPWKKGHKPDSEEPITKDEALEYLAFVEQEVTVRIPLNRPGSRCGFPREPVQ